MYKINEEVPINVWKEIAYKVQTLVFSDGSDIEFVENLKIFSCSPDIVLTLVIIFSVSLDSVPAAAIGAFAGALSDIMYENVFGINLLVYMFFALLVSMAVDRKNENSPLIMSWISFVCVSALEIVLAALRSVLISPQKISVLCANVFVKGIFAALFSLLFVLFVLYKKRKKDKTLSVEEAVE